MVKGIRAYEPKRRREMRRRNHIARDLADRKFHQRRIETKNEDDNWKDEIDDYYKDVHEPGKPRE